MKKIQDFVITGRSSAGGSAILRLAPVGDVSVLNDIRPGQFVEIKADAPGVMLRRPISVCDVSDGSLVLMVKAVGKGSSFISGLGVGSTLNIVLPLGNGFTTGDMHGRKALLVGGGVGVAPLVMLSKALSEVGAEVTVAIGGRSHADVDGLSQLFPAGCRVFVCTDDGSAGHRGLVTTSEAFDGIYDRVYCCGPTPMMKAVAAIARDGGVDCEVSLENMMACGLGACLCCVEKTVAGNVCVCTDGPVFNIKDLLWK